MNHKRICRNSRTIKIDKEHPKNSFRGGIYCKRRPSKQCPKNCKYINNWEINNE